MKKIVATILVLAVAAALPVQSAAAGKKKKPKTYKSEEASLGVPHPVFYGATGSVNAVTAKEFERRCAEPGSQGLDGHVFAIPAAFQKRAAAITATATGTYDVDMYLYDAACVNTFAFNAAGTDEVGVLPKGTAWVFVHNYEGDPGVMAHIELKA
ncbi:MAG: hypothetical protein ABR575_09890 [Actinomycetota bacterium]